MDEALSDDWHAKPACKFFAETNFGGEFDLFKIEENVPIIFPFDKVAGKMASWQCTATVQMLACDWGDYPPSCIRSAGRTDSPNVGDDFIGKANKAVLMKYRWE